MAPQRCPVESELAGGRPKGRLPTQHSDRTASGAEDARDGVDVLDQGYRAGLHRCQENRDKHNQNDDDKDPPHSWPTLTLLTICVIVVWLLS